MIDYNKVSDSQLMAIVNFSVPTVSTRLKSERVFLTGTAHNGKLFETLPIFQGGDDMPQPSIKFEKGFNFPLSSNLHRIFYGSLVISAASADAEKFTVKVLDWLKFKNYGLSNLVILRDVSGSVSTVRLDNILFTNIEITGTTENQVLTQDSVVSVPSTVTISYPLITMEAFMSDFIASRVIPAISAFGFTDDLGWQSENSTYSPIITESFSLFEVSTSTLLNSNPSNLIPNTESIGFSHLSGYDFQKIYSNSDTINTTSNLQSSLLAFMIRAHNNERSGPRSVTVSLPNGLTETFDFQFNNSDTPSQTASSIYSALLSNSDISPFVKGLRILSNPQSGETNTTILMNVLNFQISDFGSNGGAAFSRPKENKSLSNSLSFSAEPTEEIVLGTSGDSVFMPSDNVQYYFDGWQIDI